jgi:hypothetical protein
MTYLYQYSWISVYQVRRFFTVRHIHNIEYYKSSALSGGSCIHIRSEQTNVVSLLIHIGVSG